MLYYSGKCCHTLASFLAYLNYPRSILLKERQIGTIRIYTFPIFFEWFLFLGSFPKQLSAVRVLPIFSCPVTCLPFLPPKMLTHVVRSDGKRWHLTFQTLRKTAVLFLKHWHMQWIWYIFLPDAPDDLGQDRLRLKWVKVQQFSECCSL